jgi:serine/threonine protein kinase
MSKLLSNSRRLDASKHCRHDQASRRRQWLTRSGAGFALRAEERTSPESVVKKVMFSLLEAVSNLHRNSVSHRDLKPENILVRSDDFSSVVIIDFGLSIRADTPPLCDEFRGTHSALELIMVCECAEKLAYGRSQSRCSTLI